MINRKISIIIPIYNVEQFLPRCLNSVLSQSFENFELLLIDDGSSDFSGEICDNYSIMDERIIVIHKKNEGVSLARNLGIRKAKGEWITFVDSDDYLDTDYLLRLYRYAYDVDGVIMPNYRVANDKIVIIDDFINESIKVKSKIIIEKTTLFLERSASVYSKLYKRSILEKNGISFIKHTSLYEDVIFNIIYFMNCNGIFYSNTPSYYYVKYENQNSLCSRTTIAIDEYKTTLNAFSEIYGQIIKTNYISNVSVQYCNRIINRTLFSLMCRFACLNLSREEWRNERVSIAEILNKIKANSLKYYALKTISKAMLCNYSFLYKYISKTLLTFKKV